MKKILIANRGEIAVRIIRTCKEMGIKTVAVFSEPDRSSPHVLKADEAYCIGGAKSSESYLNINSIIDVIKKSKAMAVHPGYGFLSENYLFAKAVKELDVIWIGPSIESISIMGDKMTARKSAVDAGAQIVPGTTSPLRSKEEALKIANKIGFPILIKAAGGGGGKGMRIINNQNELEDAINLAKLEAQKSFSDDRIYIEKYIESPHHIEIQILADNYDNVISLGERECSIQRRYQKIIEETPSPFINDDLRDRLSESAINIAKSCNYIGAGTVEFLVDNNHNYYFLEMNTRLQVEHPITEMVTGIDLVREQILIAQGGELLFNKNNINYNGHAIECRIYAEDGFDNFTPSTGIISDLIIPNGLGVRMDEGVRLGQEITPFYDPLLGKLITWGNDRQIALNRMLRALNEFMIIGIESNIPFCLMIFNHKKFKEGQYSTDTLENIKLEMIEKVKIQNENKLLAAQITAVKFHEESKNNIKNNQDIEGNNNWVLAGRKSELR